MFPREQRLRTEKDILTVLRRGNRRTTPLVACSFIAKPGTVNRVTVIVGTQVSKKAVVRNLCKRRVRAVLRSQELPSGDLVVRLKPGAATLSFLDLKNQVLECLKNLH